MAPPAPVLETRRLILRELTLEDLAFVASMLADVEVMRYYPRPLTRAEASRWIDRQRERYAREGHGLWLVLRRDDGEPVGQVGLVRQDVDGASELEVGYLLHRPFWGRGYATESAAGARDHAFAVLSAPYVISLIRPENEPSRAVARRLGMRVWKRTRFAGHPHDVWRADRAAVRDA